MDGITFYRDPALPFLEAKLCQVKTMCYKKHFHEEYSIGIVEEGSSRVWCDGEHLEVGAGRLIGIPPFVPHACNPDERSDWSYKMLFLHPEWINQAMGVEVRWDGAHFFQEETNRSCKLLLNQLVYLLKRGAAPLETETLAIKLVETILNQMPDDRLGEKGMYRENADLTKARDYLHEHFLEKVTLEELERVSGISRFQIIRLFKHEHSLPPHAYQSLLRVNYAKKQLQQEKPLAETALEAGFYDQSHFSRVFKHCVGVTPQKYVNSL